MTSYVDVRPSGAVVMVLTREDILKHGGVLPALRYWGIDPSWVIARIVDFGQACDEFFIATGGEPC